MLIRVKCDDMKMMFNIIHVGDYTPKFHLCPLSLSFWHCKDTKNNWIMQVFYVKRCLNELLKTYVNFI